MKLVSFEAINLRGSVTYKWQAGDEQWNVISGPNGFGKTTILKALAMSILGQKYTLHTDAFMVLPLPGDTATFKATWDKGAQYGGEISSTFEVRHTLNDRKVSCAHWNWTGISSMESLGDLQERCGAVVLGLLSPDLQDGDKTYHRFIDGRVSTILRNGKLKVWGPRHPWLSDFGFDDWQSWYPIDKCSYLTLLECIWNGIMETASIPTAEQYRLVVRPDDYRDDLTATQLGCDHVGIEFKHGNMTRMGCQLPMGLRNLLTWLVDVLGWLLLANPESPTTPSGCVIVDDYDALLSLDIVRALRPTLLKYLPDVQFIMTTSR